MLNGYKSTSDIRVFAYCTYDCTKNLRNSTGVTLVTFLLRCYLPLSIKEQNCCKFSGSKSMRRTIYHSMDYRLSVTTELINFQI